MRFILFFTCLCITSAGFSQLTGFTDNFDNGKLDTLWQGENCTLWSSGDTNIYRFTEKNGFLNIAYSRTSSNPTYSAFVFWPPEDVDVSGNPEISVKIKSDVAFTWAMKPYYRHDNNDDNYASMGSVPGDNTWKTYTLYLKEDNYTNDSLYQVVFFFDPGTTPNKEGTVLFDDFTIAGMDEIADTSLHDTAYLPPFEMIERMGAGINCGNVLELKPEWRELGGIPNESWFDAYKEAGFQTVRIPVKWGPYTENVPPYSIESNWLKEVEKFVDWTIDRGMVAIINSHHDDWVIGGSTDGWASENARFDSIWTQISRYFADKPPNLVFEIYNEPNNEEFGGMNQEQLDDMNQTIVHTIRKTNPKRYIIYEGLYWSKWYTLMEAKIPDDPVNDPAHIIGSFHYYEPFLFTHSNQQKTWGNAIDKSEVDKNFDEIQDWSMTNQVPLFVGEYGSWNEDVEKGGPNDRKSVLDYCEYVTQAAKSRGMSFAYWDDGGSFNMKIRTEGTWDREKLIRINGMSQKIDLEISHTNADTIKKYEKFEVHFSMQHVLYENPYNPDEIDVHAHFISPQKDTFLINAFFDNYNDAQQWKLRFSPNMEGRWQYQIMAEDTEGRGSSEKKYFTVIPSAYHGWLQISPNNPNYLMHYDGTSFYGIGAYYFTQIKKERLQSFAQHGGNIIGYWNSIYDNEGNGGGMYLLESLDSGLGKYDQRKAARLDEILGWCEAEEIKLMLAINEHHMYCQDDDPWPNGEWHINPYKEIIDASGFYGDSAVWKFQKNKYRYIIARWGYSRSLGIWEIMNEIHGTTGYVHNKSEAQQWMRKVDSLFNTDDPYQRPTTVSFSLSGTNDFDKENPYSDIDNIHYYETFGQYPQPYDDNLRNTIYNVNRIAKNLAALGNRPAIFGEAGEDDMWAPIASDEYTQTLHNALWTGLTSGLAATPFWWSLAEISNVFTGTERIEQFAHIAQFVKDMDFANASFHKSQITVDSADAFMLMSEETSIGWMRSFKSSGISNSNVTIQNLSTGTYKLEWFDTWNGNILSIDTVISYNNQLDFIADVEVEQHDVAFRLHSMDDGMIAHRIWLQFDSLENKITCYVIDEEGRLVPSFDEPIHFTLEGAGSLETASATPIDGGIVINYQPSDDNGGFKILAEATSIQAASLVHGNFAVHSNNLNAMNSLHLSDIYPNPFTSVAIFTYSISHPSVVTVEVINDHGQIVRNLLNSYKLPGVHSLSWNAIGFPEGIYLVRLISGNKQMTKTCILQQ